jgi:hypothetical protein
MKKKLIWAIIFIVIGFLIFVGVHQYIGAALVLVGICFADLYSDEKKNVKNKN